MSEELGENSRARMLELAADGWLAYTEARNEDCVAHYTQALRIAELLGDLRAAMDYRHWAGEALAALGSDRQALAMLAPMLQGGPTENHGAYYDALISYLTIALGIPVSLVTIEKTVLQTDRFLQDAGHQRWRHKLLDFQSTLYLKRGMLREALRAAQEAWSCWVEEYPYLIADSHFNELTLISLRVGERALATRYLKEWQRWPNERPRFREKTLLARQNELARIDDRLEEALELAERALRLAERAQPGARQPGLLENLINTLLDRGEFARARPSMARLLAQRRRVRSGGLFALLLCWGDFYLGQARDAAGLPAFDDEFGVPLKREALQPAPPRVPNLARRARRAYASARSVGRQIDEKLECTARQDIIARRLDRLAAVEAALGT